MDFGEMLFLEIYEDKGYIKSLKNRSCLVVIIFSVLLAIFCLMYSKLILWVSIIFILISGIMMLKNPDDELERKRLLKWSTFMTDIIFNFLAIIFIYTFAYHIKLDYPITFDIKLIPIVLGIIIFNALIYFPESLSVKKMIGRTYRNKIGASKGAGAIGGVIGTFIGTCIGMFAAVQGGNALRIVIFIALLFIVAVLFWIFLIYSELYKLSKDNYQNGSLESFKNLREQLRAYLMEEFHVDTEMQNLEFMSVKENIFTFQLANIIEKTEYSRSFEALLDIHIDYLSKKYDVYRFDKVDV